MTQDEALTILKTGANVFLTGEPGSGKTHTINQYVAWLRKRGIEPAITASTGIAATHIGGYTIHSWSGIGVRRALSSYDLDAVAGNKRVYSRVRKATTLIIDEVSMLSAHTVSMVDAVCREVRRDKRAFGGLQVVLVGDFFQLPPVQKQQEFAFLSPAWETLNPLVCYLLEQHRQEDAVFLDFLSAVRRARVEEPHRALLRTRYAPHARGVVTQLYSHNRDVNVLNDAELSKLKSDAHQFEMTSRGPEKLVEALKRGCLSPEVLILKEGARVMCTKNDTTTHRFVNGTLGVVVGFSKPTRPNTAHAGGETGYPVVKTRSGKSLLVEPMEWSLQDGGRVLARINQLPLRLAWAMTVHKSQGMSLDGAHMDLSGTFEYGQGYVALSRVRTLQGLTLAGLNERALLVHPEVIAKDVEFRRISAQAREAFAKIVAPELQKMHEDFIKACGGTNNEKQKKNSFEAIRATHANAYRSWSTEDDGELKRRHEAGEKTKTLAEVFGRKPGAIRSRLVKLGLVE